MLIDSHTHLYLEEFDKDRDEIVKRAVDKGVEKFLLPNLDNSSLSRMMDMVSQNPGRCYPMIGLHPGSVDTGFRQELEEMENKIDPGIYCAIGEIGIDLYWDTKYEREQREAFRVQISWAKEHDLPIVIHSRESFSEIFEILDEEKDSRLRGVFHSFTGGMHEVQKIMEYDFYFGINGIVSFKNSNLREIVSAIPENRILLETDSPYLTPVPKRGKRNESSYLPYIAEVVADVKGLSMEETEDVTKRNTERLFNLQ